MAAVSVVTIPLDHNGNVGNTLSMTRSRVSSKQADSKGRVTLGRHFANKVVLVEERDGGVFVQLGRVIPERESWLYENERALGSVRKGLEQARSRQFADAPDLAAARKLADRIPQDPA